MGIACLCYRVLRFNKDSTGLFEFDWLSSLITLNVTPANAKPYDITRCCANIEDLRQLTKVPLVAKQDTILYKRIAEATSKLCSIDIENAIIESHASGEIGKVQADQTRNYCAEIATRIDTFQIFYKLDKDRKINPRQT